MTEIREYYPKIVASGEKLPLPGDMKPPIYPPKKPSVSQ